MADRTPDEIRRAIANAQAAGDTAAADRLRSRLEGVPVVTAAPASTDALDQTNSGPVPTPGTHSSQDEEGAIFKALGRAHAAGDQPAVGRLQQRLAAVQKSIGEADWGNTVRGMPALDRLGAGVAHGALSVPGALGASVPTNDPHWKPLTQTTAGKIGHELGVQGVLAPLTLATGAAMEGLGAGAEAMNLPRAAKLLRSAPAIAAADAGAQGAILNPGHRLSGALKNAALAGGTVKGLGFVGQHIGTPLTALPQARELMGEGAQLSLGQALGPKSALGRLEGAADHLPFMGFLRNARERGVLTSDLAAIGKTATADGAGLPSHIATVPDAMEYAHDTFGTRSGYGAVRDALVDPAQLATLPERASALPEGIPDPLRVDVQREVRDALSTLPKSPPPPSGLPDPFKGPSSENVFFARPPPPTPPPTTVGDLIDARHWIRREKRKAVQGSPDFVRLDALSHAEDGFTQSIKSALDPTEQALLDRVDKQYSNWKTLAGVTSRSEAGTFYGPGLYQGVRKKVSPDLAAQGGGGELRDFAHNMNAVLPEPPSNGIRAATLGSYGAVLPALGSMVGAGTAATGAGLGIPLAALAAGTTKTGQRVLLGDTSAQMAAKATVAALRKNFPNLFPAAGASLADFAAGPTQGQDQ